MFCTFVRMRACVYIFVFSLISYTKIDKDNAVLLAVQIDYDNYDFDKLMEKLAATGSTVFVVILTEVQITDFLSALQRNAKMSSDDIILIAVDGWSSNLSPDIPVGTIGLNAFQSNSTQTQRYKALWASLG